jgi:hypothetical protein
MKKTNLIVALALGLAATQVYGQGTVTFGNNSSTAITNALTMARVVAGTTFRVSLYYLPDQPVAPTREEFELLGMRIGADGPIAPAAGLYAAGTRTTPNLTAGAGFAWFQVRAWEFAFGTSYEAVRDNTVAQGGRLGIAGTSNIIRVKTGDPANNIPPGALTAFGLQTFLITQVPEPATIGIAALGIGALLLLRRKK